MAKTKSIPKKEPSPEVIAKEIFDIFNKYHVQPEHGYELLTQLQCITEKEMIKSKRFSTEIIESIRLEIRASHKMPEVSGTSQVEENDDDGFDEDGDSQSSKEPAYDAKSIKDPEGHSYG